MQTYTLFMWRDEQWIHVETTGSIQQITRKAKVLRFKGLATKIEAGR